MVIAIWRNSHLIVDPVLFIGGDSRGSPNILTNIAAECFLQIRNDAMPDAVAQRREIFVGRVFAEFEPVGANIYVDFAAPD